MKKSIITFISIFSVAFSLSEAFGSWEYMTSETGNHCTDQARGHLRYLFGENLEFSNYSEACQSSDTTCKDWIKTNLCKGYFVVEKIKGASCSHAHYGFVPIYVRRIWAYGDCKALMPHDVYPRNDNTDPYIRRPKLN